MENRIIIIESLFNIAAAAVVPTRMCLSSTLSVKNVFPHAASTLLLPDVTSAVTGSSRRCILIGKVYNAQPVK